MKREYTIGGLFLLALLAFLIGVTYVGSRSPSTSQDAISLLPTLDPNPVSPPIADEDLNTVTEPIDVKGSSIIGDASANIASASQEEFWIAGYVKGEDEKTLSNAKVYVHNMDGLDKNFSYDDEKENLGLSVTDDKGYYIIPLKGPHEYQVRSVPQDGYLALVERFTITQTEKTLAKHFVHPLAPFHVKGKGIDAQTKAPIAGADVILIMNGRDCHPQQQIEKTTSATDGTFTISRIAKGTFRLEARAEGYVDFSPYRIPGSPLLNMNISESTQGKEYVIEMEPGLAATFHVVNGMGQPVANTAIKITGDQNSYDYIGHSNTDAQGLATNKSLPKRKLFAEASHEKEGKGFSEPFEPGEQNNPTRVEIQLQGTASISGKVVYSDGTPVPGKQVVAALQSLESWAFPPSESKKPSEDGTYQIDNLAPGTYRVFISKADTFPLHAIQSTSFELNSGDVKIGVDFILNKEDSTELKGIVLDEDTSEPVEGVHVFAVIYKDGNILGSEGSQTDDKGEFTIQNVPKGGSSIQFSLQDKQGYAHTILDRPTNQDYYTLKITKSGTLSGTVVDTENQPIADAKVYPVRFFGDSPNSMEYFAKTTGNDGAFSFSELNPMDYLIRATADGYTQTDSEKVSLKKGESIDTIVIRMEKGYEISGVVIDPQGQPIPNAVISLYSYISNNNQSSWSDHFDRQEFPENARTDETGKFLISEFPLNGDTLVVQHDSFAPTKFTVSPEMFANQPYTISLTPGGSIAGTVYGSDGKGKSGVTLMTQNFPENIFRYETQTDQNGEYRFDRLTPTSYMVLNNGVEEEVSTASGSETVTTVMVSGSGGSGIEKQQYKNAIVQEGKVTRCDFNGGEGAVIRGTVYKRGEVIANAKLGLVLENRVANQIGNFLKTYSNEQGVYAFQAVEPGQYTITVSTQTNGSIDVSSCEYSTSIMVTEEQPEYTVDLYVASIEIQGTVLDNQSSEPVSGVDIHYQYRSGITLPQGAMSLSASSKTDGTFTLLPQVAGDYTFIAVKDGYASKEFQVTVPPFTTGEVSPAVPVEVRMDKDDMAIVVHLLLDGQPASTSWAHVRAGYMGGMQQLQVIPQPEPGVYRAVGMPEGEMQLSVSAYCNAKVMDTLPQTVVLQKGKVTELSLDLYENRNYRIQLTVPNESTVMGTALIEILDIAEFPPQKTGIANSAERGYKNVIFTLIPILAHQVRLSVEGYQPVVFDPQAIAQSVEGQGYLITIELKP